MKDRFEHETKIIEMAMKNLKEAEVLLYTCAIGMSATHSIDEMLVGCTRRIEELAEATSKILK